MGAVSVYQHSLRLDLKLVKKPLLVTSSFLSRIDFPFGWKPFFPLLLSSRPSWCFLNINRMQSRVRDNENIWTKELIMGLANNKEVSMLPHSWQRLIREHDVASHEPKFSPKILNMALPATATASSLELEAAVTPGFSNYHKIWLIDHTCMGES